MYINVLKKAEQHLEDLSAHYKRKRNIQSGINEPLFRAVFYINRKCAQFAFKTEFKYNGTIKIGRTRSWILIKNLQKNLV